MHINNIEWHTLNSEEVAQHLEANPQSGLSADEAQQRLERFGFNRLKEKPKRPEWLKFLDQFRNLLVIVLLGAALLAGAIGDTKDAVVILIVVVFNACLGFYQERRAEATLSALKKMLAQSARVRRGGRVQEISAEELVPGEIGRASCRERV